MITIYWWSPAPSNLIQPENWNTTTKVCYNGRNFPLCWTLCNKCIINWHSYCWLYIRERLYLIYNNMYYYKIIEQHFLYRRAYSPPVNKWLPKEKVTQALMMVFIIFLQVQSLSAQQLCWHLWQLLQPDDRLQAPRGGAEDGGEADCRTAGGGGERDWLRPVSRLDWPTW